MAAPVTDEFNTGSINPMWTVSDPKGDCTVTATGTSIQFDVPAGDHDWDTADESVSLLQSGITGDWDVSAKFNAVPGTADFSSVSLRVDDGTGANGLRFDVIRWSDASIRAFGYEIIGSSGTAQFNNTLAGGYFTAGTPFLRIEKSGASHACYTSADGVTWDLQGSMSPAVTFTRLGLCCVTFNTAATYTANADWFRVVGGAVPRTDTAFPAAADPGGVPAGLILARTDTATPGVSDPAGDPAGLRLALSATAGAGVLSPAGTTAATTAGLNLTATPGVSDPVGVPAGLTAALSVAITAAPGVSDPVGLPAALRLALSATAAGAGVALPGATGAIMTSGVRVAAGAAAVTPVGVPAALIGPNPSSIPAMSGTATTRALSGTATTRALSGTATTRALSGTATVV